MLVLIISIDFDKLLENGSLTPGASNGKAGRVVEMTKYPLIMFIVAVLWAEYCWTDRAGKVLDMKFLAQGGNVATPQSTTAICADEI